MNNEFIYSIKAVSLRTGLSPHVIRIWEKRYGAIHPSRTDSGHRRYTAAEVERLLQLRRAVEAGHKISQIAQLSPEELLQWSSGGVKTGFWEPPTKKRAELLPLFFQALNQLDSAELERLLNEASLQLPLVKLLREMLLPVLEKIGEEWSQGRMRIAQEHLASAAIRRLMDRLWSREETPISSPSIVVATPAGQRHEFGAMATALIAKSAGWQVFYLGADLPAEEIAHFAREREARMVALSIIFPPDDPYLPDELQRLLSLLPPGILLVLGGRSASRYASLVSGSKSTLVDNLGSFQSLLNRWRNSGGGPV